MPQSLLRPYYLTFRKRFQRNERGNDDAKRDLLLFVVAIVVMTCLFSATVMIIKYFATPFGRQLVTLKIVELLSYVLFMLLIASNTIAFMGNVYTAQNMNIFLAAPVSSFRLFLSKLIETTVETSMMSLVFIIPISIAFVYMFQLPLYFYLQTSLVLLPFLLIPTTIAVLISTAFAKIASVIWKRGNILLLIVGSFLCWVIYNLITLLEGVRQEMRGYQALIDYIGLFENPNPIWLPSRWASDLVLHFLQGNIEDVALKFALLWGTTLGLAAIAFLVFDLFLLTVRSSVGVHEPGEMKSEKAQARKDVTRFLLERIYSRIPIEGQARAIIIKDLTNLARDRTQALLLLTYVGISLVYLLLVRFFGAAIAFKPATLHVWWAFLASLNVFFTGFILTCVMTRLVYPSISLEGRSFWILLTGPIQLREVLRAKFLCWLPLSIVLALTLIGAGALAISPTAQVVGVSLFAGLCMSVGCTGLAIGTGALFASFEWESPNQITVGLGTLVLLLSSLVLVLLTTAPASVMTFLTMVPGLRMRLGSSLWPLVMVACAVVALLLNLAVAHYACRRGSSTLASRYD